MSRHRRQRGARSSHTAPDPPGEEIWRTSNRGGGSSGAAAGEQQQPERSPGSPYYAAYHEEEDFEYSSRSFRADAATNDGDERYGQRQGRRGYRFSPHRGHPSTWSTNVTPSAPSVSAAMLAMKSTARMTQVLDDKTDQRCLRNGRRMLLSEHLDSLRGLRQVVMDESWMYEMNQDGDGARGVFRPGSSGIRD